MSVTVKVTVFKPRCAQLKFEISSERLCIPHASKLPLSIPLAVTEAKPLISRNKVVSLQRGVGFILSIAVIIWFTLILLPQSSEIL
jgi:hypothetical protein